MNKEEVLIDFLRSLRIVLSNASAYSKEHPYFKKSVETFKPKIDALFVFLDPLIINVTADSLFIDGKYWQNTRLYVELARLFHLRKIKSVEFRKGITIEELIGFLSKVSLPIKEFLKQGGFKNILANVKTSHVSIKELDYSALLQDHGKEAKDIWIYLFRDVIENEDLVKINEFADNFEKIIAKFNTKDLFEDGEFRENMNNFLAYLKDIEKDRFYHCTKALLSSVLSDRNISQESQLNKIKVFFKDLEKEDLTETLLDSISKGDSYNYLSFKVFSQLFDEDTHKEVAPLLEERIKNSEFIKTNPKLIKRIKELFSAPDKSFIPPLYRSALSWLSKDNLSPGGLSFDHELLRANYRFLLINLLAEEEDRQNIDLITEHLLKECEQVTKEGDVVFLKFIWEVLDRKIKENVFLESSLEEIENCISDFVENAAFQEQPPADLDYFINRLRKSSLGFDFYLDKIFNQARVTPGILRLLFRFFPVELPQFYENLERKHSDIDLLANIVKSLKKVDSFLSLEMLKRIFHFSNEIIKIEVLKSMQDLSISDEEFLVSILKKEDTFLQKEALLILIRDEEIQKMALKTFLSIPSLWGRKNKILIERIKIIEDMGLKQARGYLEGFSKRRFFWNRNIREKASEVLKNWH